MAKNKITIYHNPRCSKSRRTLERIRSAGTDPDIVLYLQDPPNRKRLKELLALLGIAPIELIRRKEAKAKELKIGTKEYSDAQLIGLMVENPVLIERPIVVRGKRAVLGRPPEKVDALL